MARAAARKERPVQVVPRTLVAPTARGCAAIGAASLASAASTQLGSSADRGDRVRAFTVTLALSLLACGARTAPGGLPGDAGGDHQLDAATSEPLLAVDYYHACVRSRDRSAWCWGATPNGDPIEVPDAEPGQRTVAVPQQVVKAQSVDTLGLRAASNCLLNTAGDVLCWGSNEWGLLGDGTNQYRAEPVPVLGDVETLYPASKQVEQCSRRRDGAIYCWGGALCNSTAAQTPVRRRDLEVVDTLTLGTGYACGIRQGGVQCCGLNRQGQLGDGTTTTRSDMHAVTGVSDAIQVAAGYGHTCALLRNGSARCWGWNKQGQLGDGSSGNIRMTPVAVVGLAGAKRLSCGLEHTCALLEMGTVRCWGGVGRGLGALGDGTGQPHATPSDVVGLTDAVDIGAGGEFTCALTRDGKVYCWGWNKYGMVGDGTTVDRLTPTNVIGLPP